MSLITRRSGPDQPVVGGHGPRSRTTTNLKPHNSTMVRRQDVCEFANGRCVTPFHAAGLRQLLVGAFMPIGWPNSISPDYAGYVKWHTVQALTSYVRGVLSSHAVFKGVGVGDQAATALGAVFQFFVRDIAGMAGGIVFAYAAGGHFDSCAKQWRLFADVTNDAAMALDLASPLVPGGFMLLTCAGSVARAMVGMSAGASAAALTQHFAAGGAKNAADISAKADSRERATSIIGTLAGMAVTRVFADRVLAAWCFFGVLTLLHVWANVRALRCLVLSSLNEPRLTMLLQHHNTAEKVLTPEAVAGMECLLLPRLAALLQRLRGGGSCCIRFGARLSSALAAAAASAAAPLGAARPSEDELLQQLMKQQRAASKQQYMLVVSGPPLKQVVDVVLHQAADQASMHLRAYMHALQLASLLQQQKADKLDAVMQQSQRWVDKHMPAFLALLKQHGWQTDSVFLPHPAWTATW